MDNTAEKLKMPSKTRKLKAAFVAHEFGLYKGHGGIASYLYNICKYLLQNTNFEVTVIASEYDAKTDLLKNENFKLYSIHGGDLCAKRNKVLNILKNIVPDYVEFAEFQALGLHCVLDKSNGINFKNTLLVTNNHTASQECYEWSTLKSIKFAPFELQNLVAQEEIQLRYSDYCIAPSSFLAKYVKRNYHLTKDVRVFANPYLEKNETKESIRKRLEAQIDLAEFDTQFNITLITRFEGRKNQVALVEAFTEILKKYPNCNLFLAGNTSYLPDTGDDYRALVYSKIDKKVSDKVHFFDFLDKVGKEKLTAITDLVVLPSTFENQPMAMIEAVLQGIPVIASKYSGVADYSDNQLLFDPFDKKDMKKTIINFIKAPNKTEIAHRQKERLTAFIAPQNSILPRFSLKNVQIAETFNLWSKVG